MTYIPPLMFGPIAPENNPPINPQYYLPSVFNIVNITLGVVTTVQTNIPHNYVVGQLVRLLISTIYGSYQLNEQEGYVISIPSDNEVILTIDSTNANPFIYLPLSGTTQPQISPVGNINTGSINSSARSNTGTFIPGSFIDISPA